MTAGDLFLRVIPRHWLQSVEKIGTPTNSEIRRWFDRKSVLLNGEAATLDTEFDCLWQLVLHPKGSKRTSLVFERVSVDAA